MTNLYILCGIPASGKTTLSQQLAEQCGAKLHCFDDLPKAHHPNFYKEVRKQMWKDIAKDLRQGKTVVVDDLHTLKEWREGLLSAVENISCEKILFVMKTPLEECLKRNANRERRLPDVVVENIYESYEQPYISEGWDEIREV